nr:hypothetical protein [Streptococcus anginosus]
MQMLEDELGVTLFERRKNKLSFTETGHQTVKLTINCKNKCNIYSNSSSRASQEVL